MFVPGKLFQPSLIFVGKAGAPERCFTREGSGLTCKHYTRLEKLAMDKHPSLLQKSVNYGQKSFITLAPGLKSGLMVPIKVLNELYNEIMWNMLKLRNFGS